MAVGTSARAEVSRPRVQPLHEAKIEALIASGLMVWSGAKVIAACNPVTLGTASATVALALPAALNCAVRVASFGVSLTNFAIELSNVLNSALGTEEVATASNQMRDHLGATKYFDELQRRLNEYLNPSSETSSGSETHEDLEPSNGLKNRADKIQSAGNSISEVNAHESSSEGQSNARHIKEYGE